MIVAEFIEKLQELPQDYELKFEVLDENGYNRDVDFGYTNTYDEDKTIIISE